MINVEISYELDAVKWFNSEDHSLAGYVPAVFRLENKKRVTVVATSCGLAPHKTKEEALECGRKQTLVFLDPIAGYTAFDPDGAWRRLEKAEPITDAWNWISYTLAQPNPPGHEIYELEVAGV